MSLWTTVIDKTMRPVARVLEHDDKSVLGVNNTMALARRFNGLRYGKYQQRRVDACRSELETLLRENAAAQGESYPAPPIELRDGWAVDRSGSLPHLDRMLAEANAVIDARTGTQWEEFTRPFLQNLLPQEWLPRYPALLDFATSSALVGALARHVGFIPVLSGAQPRGIRIMESSNRYDANPTSPPRNSQRLHRDFHAWPLLYVIVALRDITLESGPFVWAGIETSDRVARLARDGAHRQPHYFPDEKIRHLFREEEFQTFAVPKGTVLFIESSRCFHYGSRNPVNPRYHLQLAYVPACRTDFTGPLRPQVAYPLSGTESRLRRMVLDRNHL